VAPDDEADRRLLDRLVSDPAFRAEFRRDPVAAARRAARLDIPVYTVALGTAAGTVFGPDGEPISVPPDPETLRAIATTSGGTSFEAADADALDRVYERLGSQISTKREKREVTTSFAGGALILVLAGGALSLAWFGRPV
jgi:Ca-activated chloride channel family protein